MLPTSASASTTTRTATTTPPSNTSALLISGWIAPCIFGEWQPNASHARFGSAPRIGDQRDRLKVKGARAQSRRWTRAGNTARKIPSARVLRPTGTGPAIAITRRIPASAPAITARRRCVMIHARPAPPTRTSTTATATANSSYRGASPVARSSASAAVTGATASHKSAPKRAPATDSSLSSRAPHWGNTRRKRTRLRHRQWRRTRGPMSYGPRSG